MENEILEDIVNYAQKRLTAAYGYCGVAKSGELAMINSDDKAGKDIKITIAAKDS